MDFSGEGKSFVRSEITRELRERVPLIYFSMARFNFEIEKEALKLGCNVFSCERDIQVFNKQAKIAPRGINLLRGEAEDFLRQMIVDFIWLDFCGPFSESNFRIIKNLNLMKNSRVIITLEAARETKETQKILNLENREVGIVSHLQNIAGLGVNKVVRYNDGQPMMVFFCNNTRKYKQFKLIQL